MGSSNIYNTLPVKFLIQVLFNGFMNIADGFLIAPGHPALYDGFSETNEFSFESLENNKAGYVKNQLEFLLGEAEAIKLYKEKILHSNPLIGMDYFDSHRSFEFSTIGRLSSIVKTAFEYRTLRPKAAIRQSARRAYSDEQYNCEFYKQVSRFFAVVEGFFKEACSKFPEDDALKVKIHSCEEAAKDIRFLYDDLYVLSRRGMNISIALYEAQLHEPFRLGKTF